VSGGGVDDARFQGHSSFLHGRRPSCSLLRESFGFCYVCCLCACARTTWLLCTYELFERT
jgi:hypothetical protein